MGHPARGPSPPIPNFLPSEFCSRLNLARQSEWTRCSHIISATALSAMPFSSKSSSEQIGHILLQLKLLSVTVLLAHPSEDPTFCFFLLGASSLGRWMSIPFIRMG